MGLGGSGYGCMEHYIGWMGVVRIIFWVGEGEYGWMDGAECGWMHGLIMPIKHTISSFSMNLFVPNQSGKNFNTDI